MKEAGFAVARKRPESRALVGTREKRSLGRSMNESNSEIKRHLNM